MLLYWHLIGSTIVKFGIATSTLCIYLPGHSLVQEKGLLLALYTISFLLIRQHGYYLGRGDFV